ncbi:hypothetical protein M8C21_022602 [Ambrosia artemisiifolia]|uniref:LOB domain-containing protein n=1 Tax=Ambrosia artemisiifolia TaxID=4212 RepID=A0AAD5CHC3_AMBAR|nr:hypothetical protein M8C21_022602 [Ambrosia artemisiifolia]
MRTIIYQSDVRSIDPVGGCYRIIQQLQRQIEISCAELDFVLQQLTIYEPQLYDDNNLNIKYNHDHVEDNNNNISNDNINNNNVHVVPRVHENSRPLHAAVCDDFKSLLVSDINPESERKEANESSEKILFDEESYEKDMIKVENVCYNEEQYGIVTDHKGMHVEEQYGS